MKRNINISRILIFSGIALFIVLDVMMVQNAYKAEQRHFRFTKQILLSNAFYNSNLNTDPINKTIETFSQNKIAKAEIKHVVDSMLSIATKDFKTIEASFKKALKKKGIDASFELAVAVTYLRCEINDSIQTFYDVENDNSYFAITGNFENINLHQPSNTFFYKIGNLQSGINISAYAIFSSPQHYLFRKIKASLVAGIIILVLFISIGLFTDYTLRKQQEVDQIKTDFINNMTHELKTPLSTLNIVSRTLQSGNEKEVQDIISNQVRKLEAIIDRVMGLSLLQSKNPDIEIEKFNLRKCIIEIVQHAQLRFPDINIKWETQDANLQITGDKFLIETAIGNMIDNAIKYGKGTNVEVRVKTENKFAEIKVIDSGNGIPKKYQRKVFDKFYRVPEGNQLNVAGSGLGLYYVKRIAIAHKGSADFTSKPGSGSEVSIKIPIV